MGDPARAIADFDAAIALDPDDAQQHINKGCAYIELGNPARGGGEPQQGY